MRSLTVKLILAFLLISVIGIGLAAVIARAATGRQFDRFIMDRTRSEFVANAAVLLPGARLLGRARATTSAN